MEIFVAVTLHMSSTLSGLASLNHNICVLLRLHTSAYGLSPRTDVNFSLMNYGMTMLGFNQFT